MFFKNLMLYLIGLLYVVDGAGAALNLSGTMLGYYPVRVLPSKTAIAPVNPTFLPRVSAQFVMVISTIECLLKVEFRMVLNSFISSASWLCTVIFSRAMSVRCARELFIVQILTRRQDVESPFCFMIPKMKYSIWS